jgi:phosphoribosylformylglycinamidine (FGAM) synthase PurS component
VPFRAHSAAWVSTVSRAFDADRAAVLDRLAGELLSNPVIEDFTLTVVDA